MSGYRPTRSQQLAIAAEIRRRGLAVEDVVIVHHVLEDTPLKLVVQIETYATPKPRSITQKNLAELVCNPMSTINLPKFYRVIL